MSIWSLYTAPSQRQEGKLYKLFSVHLFVLGCNVQLLNSYYTYTNSCNSVIPYLTAHNMTKLHQSNDVIYCLFITECGKKAVTHPNYKQIRTTIHRYITPPHIITQLLRTFIGARNITELLVLHSELF